MKILILLALLIVAVCAVGPTGNYCGDYIGMVQGKLNIISSTEFGVDMTAFGNKVECPKEAYTYDANSHVLSIPGASNPQDCLGKLIVDNGLSLKATYEPSSNIINLDVGVATITMKSC